MILTPELLKSSLQANPWKVLDSIRPAQYAEPHSNKDMLPILFTHGGHNYIGWQMKGVIPTLFGCEFHPQDILSKRKQGKNNKKTLIDSIGIEVAGGEFHTIFEKNSSLPSEVSQVFSTAENNQIAITINILVGYGSYFSDTASIGRFDLEGIPPAPAGVPQIELQFQINEYGELYLQATDKSTGYSRDKVFTGIRVSRKKYQEMYSVVSCISCSKKLRVPSFRNIVVKCPNCTSTFSFNNGIIY